MCASRGSRDFAAGPVGADGSRAESAGQYAAVAPRDFKKALAKFAPQFTGSQQHDAQELLAFLLDGIHVRAAAAAARAGRLLTRHSVGRCRRTSTA